jgi:short subunit dehydrogenase-like uncharacterized protein
MHDSWMIYGAYGFTGALVVEEAVRRGHRPLLAGRSAARLAPLAERFGLDWIAIDLTDIQRLVRTVAGVDLVFHAAGPFIHTGQPMRTACLIGSTHYVDITGEISVLLQTLFQHQAAKQQGIVLISGAGFDVIPTDCLAKYVADQISNPTALEIALAGGQKFSAGTAKTMLEMFPQGGVVRRQGELRYRLLGSGAQRVRFPHGERTVVSVPWGDLVTAYHSTRVPNITTYLAYPSYLIGLMRLTGPAGQMLTMLRPIRRLGQKFAEYVFKGPNERLRQTGRSYVWARATNDRGDAAEGWLETMEVYRFTAVGGVRCVEKILETQPQGALTPALAFGADFVLEIEGTQRFDNLDGE